MPDAMDEDEIYQVCLLRKIKHKMVAGSVRSFINLWRSINVKMLKKEYRGRFFEDKEDEVYDYNSGTTKAKIDGIELLNKALGTKNIECERLLTDDDFKKIRRLKKKAEEEKEMKKLQKNIGDGPSIHMPGFNFLEERQRLKEMSHRMKKKMEREELEGEEEGDSEEEDMDGEIIEEGDFDGEEEEGMDEEDFEGDDEMVDELDGEVIEEGEFDEDDDEDGEEEDDEDGEEEEEEEEVDMYKKKPSVKAEPKKKKDVKDSKKKTVTKQPRKADDGEESNSEVNSSFYDESSSEERVDHRASFLSSSAIFDRNNLKKKWSRDEIKKMKADNREEHLEKKMGQKIKQRGRLTNQQKKKNNPYQMFIQKQRLQNRLKDLKAAHRKIKDKNFKGHQRSKNRLGKSGPKKR